MAETATPPKLIEKSRTYYFPGSQPLVLANVTKVIEVKPGSDEHHVETQDGGLTLVKAGWHAMTRVPV